ncbi:MAG: hypothetical protein HFI72_07465 [Peptococcaceae bacterium]|nr:hypothetical protein [Peptococcaceae bacterium]
MKTNTKELRIQLKKLLETLCSRVYFNQTEFPIAYPYCIFSLISLLDDYGKRSYQLEINLIDLGKSTEKIEEIADEMQDLLDHYNFSNQLISFFSYMGQRNVVSEANKEIKRVRLLFNLYVYSREE